MIEANFLPPVKEHCTRSWQNLSAVGRSLVRAHGIPQQKDINHWTGVCEVVSRVTSTKKQVLPLNPHPGSEGRTERLNISTKGLVQLSFTEEMHESVFCFFLQHLRMLMSNELYGDQMLSSRASSGVLFVGTDEVLLTANSSAKSSVTLHLLLNWEKNLRSFLLPYIA